eukprot:1161859-Pelagomonas_calceolata.AAC.12
MYHLVCGGDDDDDDDDAKYVVIRTEPLGGKARSSCDRSIAKHQLFCDALLHCFLDKSCWMAKLGVTVTGGRKKACQRY